MNTDTVLIYSPKESSRLSYVVNFFVNELCGFKYAITSKLSDYNSHAGPKINYSDRRFDNEFFIYAENLLFKKGIEDQELNIFYWDDLPAFFATHPKYTIPFDLFSAVFLLISRYEEYLPHVRDEHDRYITQNSYASNYNFLHLPLIDLFAMKFKKLLLQEFPTLPHTKRKYQFISSIDIDNAYAFLEKGFMRTGGAFLRSILKFDLADINERFQVLTGRAPDPYDTYDYQLDVMKRYNLKVIYFMLLGKYGENDKNVPVESRKFQSLIKSLADYAEIGIHPSYGSNKEPDRLKSELQSLSKILKRDITLSRQHFLKFRLPETYRTLIEHDIQHDYSMGYANSIGFRAGTCSSFLFYDLDLEKETSLRVHPFALMDATLKYYMKVEPEQALSYITPLIDQVKKVNGTFISLWHNESLSERRDWKGWKNVYEQMVEYAV